MSRLLLIDGNAMMHRAYHALPPLTTPDGKPAHVVYGFVSMILRLYQDLKPSHIAVAFDRPGPTFRNTLYKEYQVQRPKMEDDFISQIRMVHDMVAAFGIPFYEADGFEADDVIGTICKQSNNKKIDKVTIVTGDRDILQLVDDAFVECYMPTKGLSEGKIFGEKETVERIGVKPALIPDYKALAGDSSDNYPGVPGIGPKTAIKLLSKYKTLQNMLKTTEFTTEQQQSARLSHELATIRTDAPITFEIEKARIETLDTPVARTALDALHFPSLLKRLMGQGKEVRLMNKEKTVTQKNMEQQKLF